MHIQSKKGVDIYHEYYINLNLNKMPIPEFAKIPVGNVSEIEVWNKTIGDRVKKYDVLAYLEGGIPIYSPYSGQFTEIVSSPKIGDFAGIKYAVIKTEKDETPSYPVCKFEGELNGEVLTEIVKKAALVDEIRKQYFYKTISGNFAFNELIIDGFDDQPYDLSKTATVLNFKNEVLEGAKLFAKAFNLKKISLLMGKNFQTKEFIQKNSALTNIITISGKYPTEPVIKDYCLKNKAFHIGAATCRALYRAVYFGEPDLERVITVWGDGISEPSVAVIPFGVPAQNILKEFCAFGMIERVVSGGVMTGHVASLNFPIYKWETSLTVMPLKKHHKTTECISCGRCAISCPMGLAPYYLLRNSKFSGVNMAKQLCASLCTHCGVCAYVCPSRIPLVDIIKKYNDKGEE